MSCDCTQADAVCPCDTFIHPRVIFNPPGLSSIAYRIGDFTAFRHALLLARTGEQELTRDNAPVWRPGFQGGASGDLALQMIEWWAYLADVLTFYNERIASQAYLRTADLPESVSRLIRLLGYRPRPGIGATGRLAVLTSGVKPLTLPKGFQIQSKPGPGKQPQVFELDQDVTITPPIGKPGAAGGQGSIDAESAPTATQKEVGANNDVLLAGTSSAIKNGDRVLLLPIDPGERSLIVATATAITHEKDARGKPVTRITLDANPDKLKSTVTDVTKFRILQGGQPSQVWTYPANDGFVMKHVNDNLQVDLASIVRGLKPGDPIVFETSGADPHYGKLTNSSEVVWFANPAGYNPISPGDYSKADPAVGPTATNVPPPIPILHTRLTFAWSGLADAPTDNMTERPKYFLSHGWKEVGNLIAAPAATVVGGTVTGSAAGPLVLSSPQGTTFVAGTEGKVLVEDANGNGAFGAVHGDKAVQIADPVPVLVPPLKVLSNLLPVSRGKSVVNEVLGNGNAVLAGQDFVLQNTPVTYLQNPQSRSGEDYSSTVRVWVNGLEWLEVRSFFNQPGDAQVFVTCEDEQGKTHVVFGDGTNGSRLPTGAGVAASYRYGSGADAPDAGALTVVLQPRPGLKSIRNPVPVGGGSDPDPPARIRALAPRSVLTFDRAVSVDDFEAITAATPGVTRTKAGVAFDPTSQRPRVTVWVDGDIDKAKAAIFARTDPNRLPNVIPAKAVPVNLSLSIRIDPKRKQDDVLAAVRAALLDADAGLFGVNVVHIGQAIYDSQVYAACLAVDGVQAVAIRVFVPPVARRVLFARAEIPFPAKPIFIRRVPGFCGGHRHDPGEGGFLFIPDDGGHFTLDTEEAA